MLALMLVGCSFVTIERRNYKADINPPSKKQLSFQSKEALAAGATLQNITAAEIYYKGTSPESEKAKLLYDMSYRFMNLAGVNNQFDPSDPDSVYEVFEKADKALEEKDKIIHDLQRDVQRQLEELATNKKIIRDREAELIATQSTWSARWDTLWSWIWGILIAIIVLIVGLGIAQAMTGIPFLTILFGGVRMLFNAAKQTIHGLQVVREELKESIVSSESDEERKFAERMLKKLDSKMAQHQDNKVKEWIAKHKAKHLQHVKSQNPL
jgi:hypothetical protein